MYMFQARGLGFSQWTRCRTLLPMTALQHPAFRSVVCMRGRSHNTRRCRDVTYRESYITKYETFTKTTRARSELTERVAGRPYQRSAVRGCYATREALALQHPAFRGGVGMH